MWATSQLAGGPVTATARRKRGGTLLLWASIVNGECITKTNERLLSSTIVLTCTKKSRKLGHKRETLAHYHLFRQLAIHWRFTKTAILLALAQAMRHNYGMAVNSEVSASGIIS